MLDNKGPKYIPKHSPIHSSKRSPKRLPRRSPIRSPKKHPRVPKKSMKKEDNSEGNFLVRGLRKTANLARNVNEVTGIRNLATIWTTKELIEMARKKYAKSSQIRDLKKQMDEIKKQIEESIKQNNTNTADKYIEKLENRNNLYYQITNTDYVDMPKYENTIKKPEEKKHYEVGVETDNNIGAGKVDTSDITRAASAPPHISPPGTPKNYITPPRSPKNALKVPETPKKPGFVSRNLFPIQRNINHELELINENDKLIKENGELIEKIDKLEQIRDLARENGSINYQTIEHIMHSNNQKNLNFGKSPSRKKRSRRKYSLKRRH